VQKAVKKRILKHI